MAKMSRTEENILFAFLMVVCGLLTVGMLGMIVVSFMQSLEAGFKSMLFFGAMGFFILAFLIATSARME